MSPLLQKNKFPLTWVEVDLNILKKNLRAVRSVVRESSAGILAVVKADAYGHGMLRVSAALWEEGVRFFGVATIDEALVLRKSLPKAAILVLGCFHPTQLKDYISKKITPTISGMEDAMLLSRALKSIRKFPVHVKIDTGMGRLGLPYQQAGDFFKKIQSLPGITIEGVYTHFSSADDESVTPTHTQLKIFEDCLKKIRALGVKPKYIHAANSMGVLRFKEAHFNLVRPGLVLYGLKSSPRAKLPNGIRPILSWRARISFLKKFTCGQTVSYGRTHKILKNTLIATLPVGYSHGYRVAFSNRASVIVRKKRCPVVGRVTMDQILVDVGRISGVKRWEGVALIGGRGAQAITAQDLAGLAGTIPYEIVCGIHSRVPRIYKK